MKQMKYYNNKFIESVEIIKSKEPLKEVLPNGYSITIIESKPMVIVTYVSGQKKTKSLDSNSEAEKYFNTIKKIIDKN